jgi:hypothetical protein
MANMHNHMITQLQQRWNRRLLVAQLIIVFSVAMVIAVAAVAIFHAPLLPAGLFAILAPAVALIFHRRISAKDVIIYLDAHIPALQESTALLLKDPNQLNLLQQLQVELTERELSASAPTPARIRSRQRVAFTLLAISVLVSALLFAFYPSAQKEKRSEAVRAIDRRPEIVPPAVKELSLTLTPPSYTHRQQRVQKRFNVAIEEGGYLFWSITTNKKLAQVQLSFSDKSILELRSQDQLHWTAGKLVNKPGFYQLRLNDTLSELYQLEMIKDQPPTVTVTAPKPNTLIEPWMRNETNVRVELSDDYGFQNAQLAATVASGNGEAVKFKQQQFSFPGFAPGAARYSLQKLIDLNALGMKRGDELYFYVSGTDNHGQEKRSDIFIVRIEDTAQLMSVEGLANGLDIKPEFFRSQRQIIIETEQLLRQKDTISTTEFNTRSNNLATDQKLLRLRYGKFLGEETDADIAHDDSNEPSRPEDFNNAEKILDEVTHKHDIAEDAGYFDPQTKKQLKATLAEMWKSELQLRLNKPSSALPFEYAALRLLKDLQQQSRVYVAKTGVKTPPLKPEKHLTGELDKIVDASRLQQYTPAENNFLAVRKALGLLEQLRAGEQLSTEQNQSLQDASLMLAQRAAAEPGLFLSSYQSLGRITRKNFTQADLSVAGKGLQQLLREPAQLPAQKQRSADQGLSDKYFQHLNRSHD